MSEAEKQQELKLGKQEQFMLLYKPIHEKLNRFVHSMVWDREDARDIIADTVLKAYESFDKVEHHEVFMYYMFGIASRLAKRRSRRLKFWAPFESHHEDTLMDNSTGSVARQMEVEALYRAMNRLPEKQREAVSLYEISGFSLAEVQQIQGGSLSGVKSRITRGREALAEILTKEHVLENRMHIESTLKKAAIS
jgi:RNA polymerase sigma-70 factor (ECF subfamily)